ncbi:hypothetical protein EJ03DRAFT_331572 [Teratosphaeria nubilosa]|uniref:Amidase domain-containing protein n=1 Tax=Teratosphaeria nubilosa TaxID=161662 RepID=A0A6G1KXM1_9PEZI|nr:hypothetical protein EJ03DRAFT_331572 [Teratosphaeria nubilosa]
MTIPYLDADKTLDAEYHRDDVTYAPPYVPEQFEGMPTGIQLLGRPHKDGELVAMAPIVLGALGVRA